MFKRASCITLAVIFVLGFGLTAQGQMQSENYRITTSVISGGGVPMTSNNYKIDTTLGQPSPLMDSSDPPYSTTYDLYPGFWYTLGAGIPVCDDLASLAAAYGSVSGDPHYSIACDYDGDGDVDGSDLAGF